MFVRLRYTSYLTLMIALALLLLSRLVYLYLSDPLRFPINTVKIVASYQHITRQQLATVLSKYVHESFVFLSESGLESDLMHLNFTKKVRIQRIWPGTLKIVLEEKQPIAILNKELVTADGLVFTSDNILDTESLPLLTGPVEQKKQILRNYTQMNQLFSTYGLHATALTLHENQSWDVSLENNVELHLGKQDLEKRIIRFCRAYTAVFEEKPMARVNIDLRYPRGMAVQWAETEWNDYGKKI